MHIQVKSPIDCSERSGDSTDELRTNSIGDGPRGGKSTERPRIRSCMQGCQIKSLYDAIWNYVVYKIERCFFLSVSQDLDNLNL